MLNHKAAVCNTFQSQRAGGLPLFMFPSTLLGRIEAGSGHPGWPVASANVSPWLTSPSIPPEGGPMRTPWDTPGQHPLQLQPSCQEHTKGQSIPEDSRPTQIQLQLFTRASATWSTAGLFNPHPLWLQLSHQGPPYSEHPETF